jgi:hypothetical protein
VQEQTNQTDERLDRGSGELVSVPAITPVTVLCDSLAQNPLDELAIEINRAVQHVRNAEKQSKAKAKVTLEFTIERHKKIDQGLEIEATVKVKIPEEGGVTSMLFSDADGRLLTRHPNQRDMFEGPRK